MYLTVISLSWQNSLDPEESHSAGSRLVRELKDVSPVFARVIRSLVNALSSFVTCTIFLFTVSDRT